MFLVLIMLATRKSVIELEQSPFPNQLKPDRSDSAAIVFSALRRTLFLIALTHGKPRPGGHKILFNEYATKLINPENPPFLTKFILWHRTVKLGSTWRSTVGTTGNPHDRLSRAERGTAGLKLG